MRRLTTETRAEIAQIVADGMLDTSFGDGQEADYVWDGFPTWAGINNVSDKELVETYEQVTDDDDELLITARRELRGSPRSSARKRRAPRR